MEVSAQGLPGWPACVLLNPHAGGGRAAALQGSLEEWLREHASGVPLLVCPDAATARQRLAALVPSTRVVVVGGDGTLNQLLPALLSGGHTLGLVPFGSGNDGARALALHRVRWQSALAHALNGATSAVDVGEMGFTCLGQDCTVPFLSSCTAGFDSAVGLRALRGPPWLRGLPRYLMATLREVIGLRNWPLHVVADGQDVHQGDALFASVLNTPTYGSGMPAAPGARLDDGLLNLLVAGQFGRVQTLAMLPRLLLGRHLGHTKVHTRPFRTLRLRSPVPLPLATDGEYRGESQAVCITIRPSALQVVRGPVGVAKP